MGTCGGNQQPLTRDVLGHTVAVLKKHGGNMACSARELGISRPTLRHRLERARAMGLEVPAARPRPRNKPGDSVSLEQDEKECRLITLSPRIQTAEQAMAKAEIDLDVWEPYRQIVNSWEQGSKVPGVGVAITPLWQVKVFLRRRVTDPLEAALAALVERLERAAPRLPRPDIAPRGAHMLEIDLFDHHFGKLAWSPETGQDYDLHIAEDLFARAVQYLLARGSQFRPREIVLPIGQDFFHVDNLANTTERGTPQDMDTRLPKVLEAGFMAVVKAVHQARLHAPTRVIWVPGNHDRLTSYFLCRELRAWFGKDERVTVDVAPAPRKHLRWGNTLIGYTHGEDEAHRDLPSIMAAEWPDQWAATLYREWHVGHWHKRKETVYTAGDTFNGCRVMILDSLCGTDAWHHKKGYVRSGRAATAHVYHEERGPVAVLHYNLPDGFSPLGAEQAAKAA